MNSQLNDKIYDNFINYVCVYRWLLPISIIINHTMSIITNKIITIITIIE